MHLGFNWASWETRMANRFLAWLTTCSTDRGSPIWTAYNLFKAEVVGGMDLRGTGFEIDLRLPPRSFAVAT